MGDESNWNYTPFGYLTENFDALRIPIKEADRKTGPYPYYGASGVVDWVDGFIFDGEYLLIAEDGENLKSRKTPIAFMAKGKFWVNNHAHIVQGNNKANTQFLMYALKVADINAYLTGSTMPKLTQGNLNRIPIYTPPLPEQKAIASILGALDDKIELNRKMNETLEAMARAIFKSWFVDFDPILGISPHKGWQDLSMGKIPRGWKVCTVADIAELYRNAINVVDFPDEGFEHYSIPAFDAGQMPVRELGSAIKSNKFSLPENCVLISKLNPRIPRVWLPLIKKRHHAVASTEFLVLVPKAPYTKEFVYSLFISASFWDTFTSLVTGTSSSHQRVKPDDLLSIAIVCPTDLVLQKFTQKVEPLFKNIQGNKDQSRTLASIRDALLPKLLSGDIRVTSTTKRSE